MKDPSLILDAVAKAGLCLPLGGVLFKVYIVGEAIKAVRHFSLPDVNEQQLLNCAGVFCFPRVSCAAASAEDADLDPLIAELPRRPSTGSGCSLFLQSHLLFSSACSLSLSRQSVCSLVVEILKGRYG